MRHNSRRSKNKNGSGSSNNNTGNNGSSGNNNHRRSGTPSRMHVYDSNGPDVRIRGTAHQVCEKYLALSKDAAGSGDIIMAENYRQHAEHYQRIINSFNDNFTAPAVRLKEPEMDMNNGEDDGEDLGLPQTMLRPAPETLSRSSSSVKAEEMENA